MDEQQLLVTKIAEKWHNVLLAGCLGTGKKTYTPSRLFDKLTFRGRRLGLTASTGKAASVLRQHICTDVNVTTIHLFSGIKDGRFSNDDILNLLLFNDDFYKYKCNILNVDVLVIDEVSMLSVIVLCQIEFLFRHVRSSHKPFGGVHMIL
ncbi:hypothetical protein ACJMK2_040262 [Sinanodonta woodiana]|uniref:ATP-dependent DNA helicase n=1 Tax=Sinanodonta woodiana TaxID=1069815 RepID=A0ABD3WEH1_SINWO